MPFDISGSTNQEFILTNLAGFEDIGIRVLDDAGGDQTVHVTPAGGTQTVAFTNFPGIDFSQVVRLRLTPGDNTTTMTMFAADPHVLCLDGSRLDIYAPGFYRYYDNRASDPKKRVVANVEVRENARGQDYAAALWIWSDATGSVVHRFDDNKRLFDTLVDGKQHIEIDVFDAHNNANLTFIMEGEYNAVGMKAVWSTPTVNVGGAVSGRAQIVSSLESMEDVSTRDVALFMNNARNAHALVCGSGDPHVVSFAGGRCALEENSDDVSLFEWGNISVTASFDENKHLKSLTALEDGNLQLTAVWNGNTKDQALSEMVVATSGSAKQTLRGSEGVHELWIGPLFIRMQPGGVASFQIIDKERLHTSSGLIASPLNTSMKTGKGKRGMYAQLMEPHLLETHA